MSAYNVTYGTDELLNPGEIEDSDYVQSLKRHHPSVTFDKLIRLIDTAITSIKPSESSNLVYTQAGILFGHDSVMPKKDYDYLWEKVTDVFGHTEQTLKSIGTLLRWRISLRPETWLLWVKESDRIDDKTGKKIKISCYWIDENFTPKPKKKQATLQDLADHFNSRR